MNRSFNVCQKIKCTHIDTPDTLQESINDYLDKSNLDYFISVDPGYNTALSCFYEDGIKIFKFSIPGRLNEVEKLYVGQVTYEDALYQIAENLGTSEDVLMIIENVAVWGGAAAGGKANAGGISLQSEVSSARGDLLKLARLIGVYAGVCFTYNFQCNLVPAVNWKGQLSKRATKTWVEMDLEQKLNITDHEIDSLGIGLSLIQKWKDCK